MNFHIHKAKQAIKEISHFSKKLVKRRILAPFAIMCYSLVTSFIFLSFNLALLFLHVVQSGLHSRRQTYWSQCPCAHQTKRVPEELF